MIFRFLLWLDIKILWLGTFGRSRPGETISAAAWSLHQSGKWQGRVFVPLIDFALSWREPEHCRKAWVWQRNIYPEVWRSTDQPTFSPHKK